MEAKMKVVADDGRPVLDSEKVAEGVSAMLRAAREADLTMLELWYAARAVKCTAAADFGMTDSEMEEKLHG